VIGATEITSSFLFDCRNQEIQTSHKRGAWKILGSPTNQWFGQPWMYAEATIHHTIFAWWGLSLVAVSTAVLAWKSQHDNYGDFWSGLFLSYAIQVLTSFISTTFPEMIANLTICSFSMHHSLHRSFGCFRGHHLWEFCESSCGSYVGLSEFQTCCIVSLMSWLSFSLLTAVIFFAN